MKLTLVYVMLLTLLVIIIVVVCGFVFTWLLHRRTYTGSGGASGDSANIMYHGSKHPVTAGAPEPRPSRVIDGESAVFATNSRWLALVFIAGATDDNIEIGVIGDNGKAIPYIAEARPGAFELLKIPGYIYTVSSRGFKSDPRLGMCRHEFIKRSAAKITHTERILSVWDALQQEDITLVPYRDRDAWNKKWDIPM